MPPACVEAQLKACLAPDSWLSHSACSTSSEGRKRGNWSFPTQLEASLEQPWSLLPP